MPNVAIDSSFLYALFEPSDRAHADAKSLLAVLGANLITNLPVLTEVVYLLDYSVRAQRSVLKFAEFTLSIDRDTAGDLSRIAQIMDKYADLPADFADASLIAMCERQHIGQIATLDRDFDVYRLANGQMLTNRMAGP